MKRWECAVLVPVERDRREARGPELSAFSALVLQSDCVLGGLNPERDEGGAAQEK
jgi:hypothetical protein